MASVIRNEFAGSLAASYLDKFGLGSSSNDNLFMVIGNALPWDDAVWGEADDNSPPTPDGSTNDKNKFDQYAIAAKRIPKSNVQMVIPRITWITATDYNVVSLSSADPLAAADFYVVNSNSEVFICTTDPGGNSTVEPTKALAVANIGNTKFTGVLGDGYEWEFMYTVSGSSSKADTTSWLPVSYSTAIAAGEDSASYLRLGVDNIMIIGEIDETINYISDDYRQIALYRNLFETDGITLAASDEYEIADTSWQTGASDDDLKALVGLSASDMIYLENRLSITRVATQVEELKIILSLG